MLRKVIALAAAAALILLLPTLAAAKGTKKAAPHASGTITAWNEAAKELTVKNSAGKEETFTWNEKTKVMGTAKVGEHVKVSYTKDTGGKSVATEIHVGAPSAHKAAAHKH